MRLELRDLTKPRFSFSKNGLVICFQFSRTHTWRLPGCQGFQAWRTLDAWVRWNRMPLHKRPDAIMDVVL